MNSLLLLPRGPLHENLFRESLIRARSSGTSVTPFSRRTQPRPILLPITMSSKYAAAHSATEGPGDARPTAAQIIRDENLVSSLSDKTFLITGCSSGIGIETARALASTGARLYLGVRDEAKGEKALHDILKPGHIELLKMDLNSLESMRSAAKVFLAKSKQLNVLICNAGIMAVPTKTTTADGFEAQFGTNHLAHFLLFQLLKPMLLESHTAKFHSRVVTVSSSGHRSSAPIIGDYGFEKTEYTPWKAYGQAKTANIWMANEIERRFGGRGLHGLGLHPGGIFTGLQKYVDEGTMASWKSDVVQKHMKSPEQGAATTVWAAVGQELEGKGGIYLEDCQVSKPTRPNNTPLDPGYKPHAYDEAGEKQLWVDSCRMVGESDID